MDPVEQLLRNQIAAMTRVLAMAKIFWEDNYPSTIEASILKDFNIIHILIVTNCLEPSHLNDFVYKVINVADREDINLRQYFEECFKFIDEGKRAGVFLFIALITVSQTLEYVRSRRSRAFPNASFIRQLQEFELCVTNT
ncbi:hypothetical protein UlMin_037316 [Ulmus minor]